MRDGLVRAKFGSRDHLPSTSPRAVRVSEGQVVLCFNYLVYGDFINFMCLLLLTGEYHVGSIMGGP